MKLKIQKAKEYISRHIRVAAYAVIGIGFVVYAISAAQLFFPQVFNFLNSVTWYEASDGGAGAGTTSTAFTLERSLPTRLRVPALSIDTDFSAPLGLKENKEVEVPKEYDKVGWYKYGPTPGALGPAVVFGHVDSVDGAAVFFSLGQLKEGDSIFVDRADGSTAEFEVTALERYPQSDFPTQKVYGNLTFAGIRLITCTGTYDKGELRYTHNLVVYGKLKGPVSSQTP